MRDKPTGEALLAAASFLLRNDVLPILPAEHKHSLLMALNAMSIAERQLKFGEAPEAGELIALSRLLGKDFEDVRSANVQLATSLRAGVGDPGQSMRLALFTHLKKVGTQRLLESNPKALNN